MQQSAATRPELLKMMQNGAFRNCGLVPESAELTAINDAKVDDEGDAAEVPQLETLSGEQRQNEIWQEGWLRIFTDGGVSNPDDNRVSIGGCGIAFGQGHPFNTPAAVKGQRLDSYRAELQAVRLLVSGTRSWTNVKLWITLDNKAVVDDIQRCIEGSLPRKVDNVDIWQSLSHYVRQRAEQGLLRVTWTKGHATDEDIERGRSSELERERNKLADELATEGKKKQDSYDTLALAARQRTAIAVLIQTMMIKIWKSRRILIDQENLEAQILNDELEAIRELEGEFKTAEEAGDADQDIEQGYEQNAVDTKAQLTWQQIRQKVPTYQWQQVQGSFQQKLRQDKLEKGFKPGKRSYTYAHAGGKTLIPLNFPLHLWSEVAEWWQKLSWSTISTDTGTSHSYQVTWLELLVDFEVATGIRCCEANACPLPPWGERARLLQRVVIHILKVRGGGLKELKNSYGVSYAVSTLAPIGQSRLKGLRRRPCFVGGEATIKVIAKSCWRWAQGETTATLQSSQLVDFTGFKVGNAKSSRVQDQVLAVPVLDTG